MSIFNKKITFFEGSDKAIFEYYKNVLRDNNIDFKAYTTDNNMSCCASPDPHRASYTYTIFVKAKDADAAKNLVKQGMTMSR